MEHNVVIYGFSILEKIKYRYVHNSDRVRAARCAFSHIKLEKRALLSRQMCEYRISRMVNK